MTIAAPKKSNEGIDILICPTSILHCFSFFADAVVTLSLLLVFVAVDAKLAFSVTFSAAT